MKRIISVTIQKKKKNNRKSINSGMQALGEIVTI